MNYEDEANDLKEKFNNLVKLFKKHDKRKKEGGQLDADFYARDDELNHKISLFFKDNGKFIRSRKNSLGTFSVEDYVSFKKISNSFNTSSNSIFNPNLTSTNFNSTIPSSNNFNSNMSSSTNFNSNMSSSNNFNSTIPSSNNFNSNIPSSNNFNSNMPSFNFNASYNSQNFTSSYTQEKKSFTMDEVFEDKRPSFDKLEEKPSFFKMNTQYKGIMRPVDQFNYSPLESTFKERNSGLSLGKSSQSFINSQGKSSQGGMANYSTAPTMLNQGMMGMSNQGMMGMPNQGMMGMSNQGMMGMMNYGRGKTIYNHQRSPPSKINHSTERTPPQISPPLQISPPSQRSQLNQRSPPSQNHPSVGNTSNFSFTAMNNLNPSPNFMMRNPRITSPNLMYNNRFVTPRQGHFQRPNLPFINNGNNVYGSRMGYDHPEIQKTSPSSFYDKYVQNQISINDIFKSKKAKVQEAKPIILSKCTVANKKVDILYPQAEEIEKVVLENLTDKKIEPKAQDLLYEICDNFIEHMIMSTGELVRGKKKMEKEDIKLIFKMEFGLEIPE